MQTGKIRQMSRYRGFGFIRNDAGGEVFFQRSDVGSTFFDMLQEGNRVRFNIGLGTRGFKAHNLTLIDISKGD